MRETVWIDLFNARGDFFRSIEVNAVVKECGIVTHEGRWYMSISHTNAIVRSFYETDVFHVRG